MTERELVIVLTSDPTTGGGFQYSRAVLQALALVSKKSYRLSAVCLNSKWEPIARPLCHRVLQVKPFTVGWKKLRGLLRRLPYGSEIWRMLRPFGSPLWRQLRALKPDLVFFACEPQLMLESPAPAIAPIHDLMYLYERRFPEVGTPSIFRGRLRVDRMVCREARGILVDSKLGAQHVQESFGVEATRLHVLPFVSLMQTDTQSVPPDLAWCASIPAQYVLYPAQFWQHKNHLGLLQALRLLRDQGLIVNAVFCGSEKDADGLVSRLIIELGIARQVKILGFVSDNQLNWLYRNAIAMVMPSFFGPTNIPPLEAMQLGCPVAVSRIYASEEQLGDAALYFDPRDSKDIARAVRLLWTQPALRRELVEKGYQRIHSWSFADFVVRLDAITSQCLTILRA